ncbi:MAG: hypothetical protein ACYCX4_12545 [Bacillota bacterium]
MDNDFKVKENFLRRQAKRLGLFLSKSKAQKWSVDNQGGYRIIRPKGNIVMYGKRYELSFGDAERILNEIEKKVRE